MTKTTVNAAIPLDLLCVIVEGAEALWQNKSNYANEMGRAWGFKDSRHFDALAASRVAYEDFRRVRDLIDAARKNG